MIERYIANVFINSILSFFTVYLLIEVLRICFRVRSPRFLALCYTLPFLKIVIDPFLYNFSSWTYALSIPLQKGERAFTAAFGLFPKAQVRFSLREYGFCLGDLFLGESSAKFIAGIGLLFSVLFFMLFCKRLLRERKVWKELLAKAELSSCKHFYLSSEVVAPLATCRKVLFPKKAKEIFSEEEMFAALAHEKSHLTWKDGQVRLVLHGVLAVFWWIPGAFLLRKIINEQEKGADRAALKKGALKEHLLSALIKSSKEPSFLVTSFASSKGILERVKAMDEQFSWRKRAVLFLPAAWWFLSVLLGEFWIF